MTNELLTQLIGLVIEKVWISQDESTMYFQCLNHPTMLIYVEGDCCSEAWFSDVFNFDVLIGTVSSIEEINMPEYNTEDGRGRQEVDDVYGLRIVTDKGAAVIAFRNSSNGYYGGSIERVEETDDTVLADCKQINDDWKA